MRFLLARDGTPLTIKQAKELVMGTRQSAPVCVPSRSMMGLGCFEREVHQALIQKDEVEFAVWLARNFWRFPEDEIPIVFQVIFDYATTSGSFRDYLISERYQKDREVMYADSFRSLCNTFDQATGNSLASIRWAEEMRRGR